MKYIENLGKSYGEKVVFRGLSARFPDCGTVCVTGPSGSGKTKLLRILSGLVKPTEGTVSGFDTMTVSFAFQEPRLLPWLTARDNVAYVLKGLYPERLELAQTWLDRFGMILLADKYPTVLSGGEAQRVSLARAFAAESTLLLLDEPTTGLDADLRNRVMEEIRVAGRQKLVVYVSHNAAEIEAADSVISLG